MAASQAGRDLAYFTFGDDKLRDGLFEVYCAIQDNQLTVGEVFTLVRDYELAMSSSSNLFGHILAKVKPGKCRIL